MHHTVQYAFILAGRSKLNAVSIVFEIFCQGQVFYHKYPTVYYVLFGRKARKKSSGLTVKLIFQMPGSCFCFPLAFYSSTTTRHLCIFVVVLCKEGIYLVGQTLFLRWVFLTFMSLEQNVIYSSLWVYLLEFHVCEILLKCNI